MLMKITSIAVGCLTLLALSIPAARPARAAPASVTFTVNSTKDQPDDPAHLGDGECRSAQGHCTLRAAVMEADHTSGVGATIILPAGVYSLTIPISGTDDASSGDLNLSALPDALLNSPAAGPSIALEGAGAARTIIDANQLDRVLTVESNRTATVSGVTLRDGFVSGRNGGALSNSGTLTVTNSTLTASTADTGGGLVNLAALTLIHSTISGNTAATGGGAFNDASLTLIDSTVSGNSATSDNGGGLYNNGNQTLFVIRSTISGNHANDGGGVFNASSRSLILINSTLCDNYSVGNGGGIENDGMVNIYSTTIAGNWADSDQQSAGSGGGVYNNVGATFNLLNSLLVGNNLSDTPQWSDCAGSTIHAYGTDFIGLEGVDETPACPLDQPLWGNLYKLNSLAFLSGLQDNGGPTRTIALLRGSSAISSGSYTVDCVDENAVPLATDQRGVKRVLGAACDIGAFEFMPPSAFLPFVGR